MPHTATPPPGAAGASPRRAARRGLAEHLLRGRRRPRRGWQPGGRRGAAAHAAWRGAHRRCRAGCRVPPLRGVPADAGRRVLLPRVHDHPGTRLRRCRRSPAPPAAPHTQENVFKQRGFRFGGFFTALQSFIYFGISQLRYVLGGRRRTSPGERPDEGRQESGADDEPSQERHEAASVLSLYVALRPFVPSEYFPLTLWLHTELACPSTIIQFAQFSSCVLFLFSFFFLFFLLFFFFSSCFSSCFSF